MAYSRVVCLVCLLLVLTWSCLCLGEDHKVRYDRHQLWRLKCDDEECSLRSILEDVQADIWQRTPGTTDLLVSPGLQEKLRPLLETSNITYQVVQGDIQQIIDKQMNSTEEQKYTGSFGSIHFGKYHPLDTITKWMTRFARENKNIVTLVNVGKSYHGRQIKALKIGASSATVKDGIWIQAGVHAREWITHASALYMANQLVSTFGSDPVVTNLLVHFDWYIVPVLNPDGYAYTWETDRLWRKTRSRLSGTTCIGVDGNRNYGYQWGGKGSSSDPCHHDYMGPFPFSEPEIYSVANFLSRSDVKFRAFLDLHSYSQLWLTPWSYTDALPPEPDFEKQNATAHLAVEAIRNVHGKDYTAGPMASIMYQASGTATDWAYGDLGIIHAYTVELRDRGTYGFLLPEHEIRPTSEELFAGIKEMGKILLEEKQID